MVDMKSLLLIAVASLMIHSSSFAQIPTNSEKKFEYHAEADVRRAGTGDIINRLNNWAKTYYQDMSLTISRDDSTNRFLDIQVEEGMVESHFGVARKHSERKLSYHIKFDCDRKSYFYWINDFRYAALEVDKKGVETNLDTELNELKTAARKAILEEVHTRMEGIIEAFKEAAEIDIE